VKLLSKYPTQAEVLFSSVFDAKVISIPKDGDADNIMTEFKEGVLKISIP
jgi:hypothetical protein